mmetsp:Transcript_9668/g.20401  ORF Transcript_9668/g.20401 Transcript_9668/m.20401 type:complete len:1027 (+) Transcript_9668:234-3314(+)
MTTPRAPPALNDAQKGDLAELWGRHAPYQIISIGGSRGSGGENDDAGGRGRGGRYGGRGRGRGGGGGSAPSGVAPTTVAPMTLEDEDYHFICRLYSFLRWNLDCLEGVWRERQWRLERKFRREERERRRKKREWCDVNSDKDQNEKESDESDTGGRDDDVAGGQNASDATKMEESCRDSRTVNSLLVLFRKVKVRNKIIMDNNSTVGSESTIIVAPRIRGGKQIVSFDHTSFIQEFLSYENNGGASNEPSINGTFESYLGNFPDRAIASLGCSIGLVVLTLWRRHQQFLNPNSNPLQYNQQQQQPQSQLHPQLATLQTTIYKPRFYNLTPPCHLRLSRIRTSTVGHLISLRGTVTKARPKRLRVLDAGFTCAKCGLHQIRTFVDGKYSSPTQCEDLKCKSGKFVLNRKVANFCDVQELKIQECREEFCEDYMGHSGAGAGTGGMGGGHGENRDAGRAPRHIEIEVTDDLVDSCNAGDSIIVVGIVRAVNSALASGSVGKKAVETSTYKLYVVAHSINNLTAEDGKNGKRGGFLSWEEEGDENKRSRVSYSSNSASYTSQQLQQIANLAHADHRMYSMPTRMAFPFDLLVRSLCPTIIGNDLVKAGIILCLLGGTPPEVSGLEARSGMTIRSNSHMLVVGDPGMGKSQMLLSANQVATRSVYVGGNTASSTGLTVSMTKEAGGDMGIEAGALVLADRGVCCLDELDKMPKSHQDGLLEAMEQQQVSIAKAGVVASLPSRCSVIAAANPKTGHYNMSKSVAENLNMAGPLLSRFDLVFILRDEADTDRDRMISSSIMENFRNSDRAHVTGGDGEKNSGKLADILDQYGNFERVPLKYRLPWVADFQKQPLPMQQIKEYIAYAREYCRPKMTTDAANVLQDYFMKLRDPQNNDQKKDNVPITTRQLEALIRLSQARAKACLRPYVLREDAEDVVELMIESVKQVHTDESGKIDKTRGGAGGKSKKRRIFLEAMINSGKTSFELRDLQIIAEKLSFPISGFKDFIEDLREGGDIMRSNNGSTAIYTLSSF